MTTTSTTLVLLRFVVVVLLHTHSQTQTLVLRMNHYSKYTVYNCTTALLNKQALATNRTVRWSDGNCVFFFIKLKKGDGGKWK